MNGVLSMLLAPINIALANAINKRLLLMMRNGEIVDSGSCPGQSEKLQIDKM